MTLTQKDIAEVLDKEFKLSVRQSQALVSRVLQLIREQLVSADDARCELRGLGIFATFVRPARDTFHPVTGEPVHIPERRGVRYRCSKELKDALNAPKPVKRKKASKKPKKPEF